jgi:hypothetical protein
MGECYTRLCSVLEEQRRRGCGTPRTGGLSSTVVVTSQPPSTGPALARDVALYSAARLAMVAIPTLLLVLAGVPLVVSVLLAVVVALPLSMMVLGSLRGRVNAGLALAGQRRRAERDRLRQQLRGR